MNCIILTDEKTVSFISVSIFVILFLLSVASSIVGGFIYWKDSAFTTKNMIIGGIIFFVALASAVNYIKKFFSMKIVFIDLDTKEFISRLYFSKKVIEIPFNIICELNINTTEKYGEDSETHYYHHLKVLGESKKLLFSTKLMYLPDLPEMIDHIKVVYREIEE